MTDTEKTGVRRGCLTFLVVVLVLCAGAGLSVLIFGKSPRPKAREVIISRPKARLDEIQSKLDKTMPAEVKEKFITSFGKYSDAIEKSGAQGFAPLGELNESLREIESDNLITAEEALKWMEQADNVLKNR